MSATVTDRKRIGRRRIPGKVVLPVAAFVSAAAVSAAIVWALSDGPRQSEVITLGSRAPSVELPMPPPLAPAPLPAKAPPPSSELAATQPPPADDLITTLPPALASSAEPEPEPPVEVVPLSPAAPTTNDAPEQIASLPATPEDTGDAPDPLLVERTPQGLLPRIAPDGREPWREYARPFDATDARPRVAVVLTPLGLSSAATEAAIQGLPGGVTLAFQPYADNLQHWIQLARAAGHEVLLNLPMEPTDYPSSDPGPQALFTALTPQQNLSRLDWALGRVTGYVGVTNYMGSRFTTSREAMLPVLQTLKDRGLLFLDSRASARSVAARLATELDVPRAINDRFLDTGEITRTNIDTRLAEVERIANEVGTSVVIGQPYPVTIERLREWLRDIEARGITLAPLSAVVNLQEDR